MRHKLAGAAVKLADVADRPGLPPMATVRARIATLAAVDSDGDSYAPGAFGDNDDVLLSVWNHGSWRDGAGALPIGRGSVFERDGAAEFAGVMLLGSDSARSHFELLKAMGSQQRWSFGYEVLRSRPATTSDPDGALRVLQRLQVFEVSPVLRAAGLGTATLSLAGPDGDVVDEQGLREYLRFVRATVAGGW